jgi:hypothetical protein
LEEAWKAAPSYSSYYPGSDQRWRQFAAQYSDAKVLFSSQQVREAEEKKQELDNSHLPLLMPSININLSTPEGRVKAEQEYILRNEAFAPVLSVITLEDEDFLPKAVTLCNDYMYGTLSCTISYPAAAEGNSDIEQAIADLKYGAVNTNAWAAASFTIWSLTWGGVYGEFLDKVESGIGAVGNCMLFSKTEKSVFRTPTIHPFHFDFCKSPEEIAGFNNYVANLTLGVDPTATP